MGFFDVKPVQCNAEDNIVSSVFSVLMIFAIAGSYIPQHIKIIVSKSSQGISNLYLLMGSISMTGILMNTFAQQFELFLCCSSVSGGKCVLNLLSVMQIFVQSLCFYLLYFPRVLEQKFITNVDTNKQVRTREYNAAFMSGLITLVFVSLTGALTGLFLYYFGVPSKSPVTLYFSACLGLLSMIVSSFQFFPQLWTTFKAKRVGALSIPTMAMQVPGAFILVYTLSASGVNFTAWITYLLTGTLQTILLIMCIIFAIREKREALEIAEAEDATRPLIKNDEEIVHI